MADKTLTELRDAVAIRYGDPNKVTITDPEIDLFLKDGYLRCLAKCPWLNTTTQTITATTDAVGAISLTDPNVGQLVRVALLKNGTYETLLPMPMKSLNDQFIDTTTTLVSVSGYVQEGAKLFLYPQLVGTSVTVLVLYEASVEGNFPTIAGNKLPVAIPQTVDDIIIRFALSEFYMRDGDFDSADRAKALFNEGVQELVINHNKPRSGESIQPTNTDFYLLDRDYFGAW